MDITLWNSTTFGFLMCVLTACLIAVSLFWLGRIHDILSSIFHGQRDPKLDLTPSNVAARDDWTVTDVTDRSMDEGLKVFLVTGTSECASAIRRAAACLSLEDWIACHAASAHCAIGAADTFYVKLSLDNKSKEEPKC